LDDSFATLGTYGNLGSTAILFVLDAVMKKAQTGDHIMTLAFGPGVTVEYGVFCKD
jgi:alpha-pyrone synthase